MLVSTAIVTTDAPARYAKQLLSHLGHKVTMEPLLDQPPPAGRLVFAYGVGTVLPMPGQLILRATAADLESLARVQDVLQRHLEKFGARRELAVSWGPVEPSVDDETIPGQPTPASAEADVAQSAENSDLAAGLDPDRAQQS